MAAAPPALPVELVEEILLRLPPNDPACLVRASLVCKTWGGAVSHHGFRRRLHEIHRTPPVLGFLHNWDNGPICPFVPTTSSAFSLAAPDLSSWRALDCRHGRALFLSKGQGTAELLLWEPITGDQQRVPVPAEFKSNSPIAAVFCAAVGCDHSDCLGGPFRVVFVFSFAEDAEFQEYVTSACVYSSETGTWGELASSHGGEHAYFSYYSSVIVGSSLLYFMSDNGRIQEYDLARHCLNVFDAPDDRMRSNLVLAEDGGLGVIQDLDPQLKLWSREKSDGADARWVLSRVIILENLLPNGALEEYSLHVLGFAEGTSVIFVTTAVGLFTIELQSQRVKKVCDDHGFCNLIPVVSFYTPHSKLEALRGEYHYPPLSPSPTEDVGGKEGRWEEKTSEQMREVFDKCKATEEGNFANASDCLNHTQETRVPHHGELPPDPSGIISKNAPNEGSIENTATTSKDDPGSSEASRDQHGDFEEACQNEPGTVTLLL